MLENLDPDVTGENSTLVPCAPGGQQFLYYGNSGSGIPGTPAEVRFTAVNAMDRRLCLQPEFNCFLGNHIYGDAVNAKQSRSMWRYWLDHEMTWYGQAAIPIYQTTSKHNTYNTDSERVWNDVFPGLPQNGPLEQAGVSYDIRRGDLLIVAVNTCLSGLGAAGHVEYVWLDRVLTGNAEAVHNLVLGHYLIHPVNG